MADGPRNRPPFTSAGDRAGRGRDSGGNRRDEGRRDTYGNDRGSRGSFGGRREGRSPNPQTITRRTVHYQVVMMDEEEWGDALENRLNALGHEGWRLVAIDDGRQYVFMQTD